MKDQSTLSVRSVNAIQCDGMEVRIQSKVSVGALYHGDGTTLAHYPMLVSHSAPIEAKHRVINDTAHRRKQLAVVGQSRAKLEGERDHELAQRNCRGQHMVHQVGCGLGHPSAPARRAPSPSFAAEGYQPTLWTLLAFEQGEAPTQKATLKELLELTAHEPGQG